MQKFSQSHLSKPLARPITRGHQRLWRRGDWGVTTANIFDELRCDNEVELVSDANANSSMQRAYLVMSLVPEVTNSKHLQV